MPSPQTRITVRAERIPNRHDLTGVMQLHLPAPLWQDVQRKAERLGRSAGWCLWMGWCLASLELGRAHLALLGDHALLQGERALHPVQMPLGSWRSLSLQAEQQDRSRSWLLARAWVLARHHFSLAQAS